jgi:L-amino acid N-acyltransferase YncA
MPPFFFCGIPATNFLENRFRAGNMTELSLRNAGVGDIPAMTRIYADAVLNGTASYELDPPDEAEMARRFAAIVEAGYPWLVAVGEGDIAGYAYAGQFRARPAYRFIVEDSIYIAPEAKGQGIGKLLLDRLIKEVESLGFRQIVSVIGDGANHVASIRLHERAGFVHSGTIAGSGYKFGRWLDTVIMQLPLNGGVSSAPDPDSLPERSFLRNRRSSI